MRELPNICNYFFSDLDQTQERLMNANTRLDDREKALLNAEGEVAALNRRIQNLEEELEKTEDRFVNRFIAVNHSAVLRLRFI